MAVLCLCVGDEASNWHLVPEGKRCVRLWHKRLDKSLRNPSKAQFDQFAQSDDLGSFTSPRTKGRFLLNVRNWRCSLGLSIDTTN